MRRMRQVGLAGAAASAAIVLSSCGFGVTHGVANVFGLSATLTGVVGNTEGMVVAHWFEYGTTTEYGSTTERLADRVEPRVGLPVEATVTGLEPETEYHYRLCGIEGGDTPACGKDRTFTTTASGASVTGRGTLAEMPELANFGASVEALSAGDGSEPLGEVIRSPSSYDFRWHDRGPVTCLRVEGNRAAVGFEVIQPGFGGEPREIFDVLLIEDNGPTGDRLKMVSNEAPGTTCPEPNAEALDAVVLIRGDFVVRSTGDGS